jgi:hypothetical protein
MRRSRPRLLQALLTLCGTAACRAVGSGRDALLALHRPLRVQIGEGKSGTSWVGSSPRLGALAIR